MQVGINGCLLGNLTDEQSSTCADSADLRSASVYYLCTFGVFRSRSENWIWNK